MYRSRIIDWLYFSQAKLPVDSGVHFEYIQVIVCDIKPGSVERSRDVENETISKGFIPLRSPFSNSVIIFRILFEAINSILKKNRVYN
jgi:hypothetical protein